MKDRNHVSSGLESSQLSEVDFDGARNEYSLEQAIISGEGLLHSPRPRTCSIDCILPAFNEEKNLPFLIPDLCQQLERLSADYWIIVVDDGSTDKTAEIALGLSADYPVRLLQLARNFGKESALTAGLENSSGDLVILMDADFQHPIEVLPVFFDCWVKGYDMVYGIRQSRADEAIWKRKLSAWFYKFMSHGAASNPLQPNAGDFRLMDRVVVEAMCTLPENSRFMKGLYNWVGFKSIGITYRVGKRREGKGSFNFLRLSELAITGITSFTSLPLRLCAAFGAIVSLFSMLYGLFITVRTLIFGIELPGWATLAVAITFLSGIQLLSIGILGEYVARIFIEAKNRPAYIVGRRFGFSTQEKKIEEQ